MHKFAAGVFAAALVVLPALAPAQSSSAPATSVSRREVIVPPEFQKFTINGRTVLSDAQDAAWLKEALPKLKPATQPTTMPGDLLAHLKAGRSAYIQRATADLALPDDKAATEAIDQMIDRLQKLDDLQAPIIFFATTEPVLHALMKAGWTDPRFYYNRAADDIEVRGSLVLRVDRPMDDALIPVLFDPKDSDEERQRKFLDRMPGLEASFVKQRADEAKTMIYGGFATLAADKAFTPLKLPREHEWFGMGVTNYLAVRYLADLGAGDFGWLFDPMTQTPAKWPVQPSGIDLAHPLKEDTLRPEMVKYYNDAMRWKSAAVLGDWVKKAGPDAIGKVMLALRTAPPKDDDGLIALIKDKSGVDLTAALKQ